MAEQTPGQAPMNGMPQAPQAMPGQVSDQDIANASPEPTAIDAAKQAAEAPDGEEMPNATPEEQAEYERVFDGLSDMLYENDQMSKSISGSLMQEDPMGSTIQAALVTIQQLDERLDMDEIVIPQITQDTTEMIMELGEAKGLQYTGRQAQQILAGVWEGVMIMFGGEDETINEDYAAITEGMSEAEINDSMATYQKLLSEGTGAGEMEMGRG